MLEASLFGHCPLVPFSDAYLLLALGTAPDSHLFVYLSSFLDVVFMSVHFQLLLFSFSKK